MFEELVVGAKKIINLLIYFFRIGPQGQTGACPTGNCLGMTAFLVVTAVQLGLMLAYTMYR